MANTETLRVQGTRNTCPSVIDMHIAKIRQRLKRLDHDRVVSLKVKKDVRELLPH